MLDLRLLSDRSAVLKFLVFNVVFDVLNSFVLIFAQGHHIHLNYTKPFLRWVGGVLAHAENAGIETLHYDALGRRLALLFPIELRREAVVFKWHVVALILRPVVLGFLGHNIVRISQSPLHFLYRTVIDRPFLTPELPLGLLIHTIVLLSY